MIQLLPPNDTIDDTDEEITSDDDTVTELDIYDGTIYDGICPHGEIFTGQATGTQCNNVRVHDGSLTQVSKLRIGNDSSEPIWINYQA